MQGVGQTQVLNNLTKLSFRVCYFSSEDAGYPASELNVHGPATLGWQSLKFCDYPQEIGLLLADTEMPGKMLSQVQLLSHQSKIASRIEIFVGLGRDYGSASFERLGFMTLDVNERSNLTARELKTVYIDDKPAQFLKFIIHRPHHNTQNLFTQIGIIAINILGHDVAPEAAESKDAAATSATAPAPAGSNELMKNATSSVDAYMSGVTNDLKYTYSMDAQTAKRLKYLADSKEAAISCEDFTRAKHIKILENELKKYGSRLVQLDVAKADAVKAEDFDLAKEYKDEAEKIRIDMDKKIANVLSNQPAVADAKDTSHDGSPARREAVAADGDDSSLNGGELEPPSPDALASSLPMASPEQQVPVDVEPVDFDAEHPLKGVPGYQDLPEPENFTDETLDIAEQSGIIAKFGEYRAKCIFSKVWALREAVMTKFRLMLESNFFDRDGFEAYVSELATIIRIGVDDKFQQVLFKAVGVLSDVLKRMGRTAKLPRSVAVPFIDPIVTILVDKLSDGNHRFREGGRMGIDEIANAPVIGPSLIIQHVMKPLSDKKRNAWRPIVSRLKLLADFVVIYNFGGSTPGFSPESILSFIKSNACFSHSHGEVRDAARDLTVSVQMLMGGPAVEGYLKLLRPKQLEEYQLSFQRAQERAMEQQRGADGYHNPKISPRTKRVQQQGSKVNTAAVRAESKMHASLEEDEDQKEGSFTKCLFCGAGNESWNEDTLDLHYWKDCPILVPCPACAQVVEVAGLPDHLLGECEYRESFTQCKTTGLAIRSNELPAWQQSSTCRAPPANCFYCPLCLAVSADDDTAWRRHLCFYCKKNPRGNFSEGSSNQSSPLRK